MSAKQKIVHCRGPSNLNLGIFVCSFDVCRASKPSRFINYDQSDRLNGAWHMPRNSARKTQSKVSCSYTWLLHGKNWHRHEHTQKKPTVNCPSQCCFLRILWTRRKPIKRSITATKRVRKGKKRKEKKKLKKRRTGKAFRRRSLSRLFSSQNFDFCPCSRKKCRQTRR